MLEKLESVDLTPCDAIRTSGAPFAAHADRVYPIGGRAGADMVLRSRAMKELYDEIEAIARGDINVLILGETGVGKDVLATYVHRLSKNARGPFMRLNCAALPAELLESELFGYERGAFTGAHQQKPGLLVEADGGTVFLDEVGELPQRLQAKLLQVLETREIWPLGATKPKKVETRFVSATNRDLESGALLGGFRSDLYYRIAGYTALIPPLRERREDVLPLALAFLRGLAARNKLRAPNAIRDEAKTKLFEHTWPGNVRELRNVIERAFVLAAGGPIGCEHLPLVRPRSPTPVARGAAGATRQEPQVPVVDLGPEELAERERILSTLAECGGNQCKAAERLGFSRSKLLNRLDAYRIKRPRKRPR